MKKRKPHSALYWKLRHFFRSLTRPIDRFRARHLSIGKQKWRDGKLYIEKIPPYIASWTTVYLTAIIRDYLRASTRDSFPIRSSYFREKFNKNMLDVTEEEMEETWNEQFEHWKQMVGEVADKFDESVALWEEAWETRDFTLYRAKIEEAFSALARIFQDLND